MTGRGQTGTRRPARQPTGPYQPTASVAGGGANPAGLSVAFYGDDGRQVSFPVGGLPLPGWHPVLAAAFAERTGPAGTVRTLASAKGYWAALSRFVRYLSRLPEPPARPADLTAAHVDAYEEWRLSTVRPSSVTSELVALAGILQVPVAASCLQQETLDHISRKRRKGATAVRPGYSDRELALLTRAARDDVAQLRDRITAAEQTLAAGAPAEAASTAAGLSWQRLAAMAQTGLVPSVGGSVTQRMVQRLAWASQLYLTLPDVVPLLALFIVVSGRNVETVKELPAEHRVIEGRAVEVVLTKRRRGRGQWSQTVTWEIGPPHRQLHTPGGLYLLAHQLMARSRAHSGTDRLWSVWRNEIPRTRGQVEHTNPFDVGLHAVSSYLRRWSPGTGATADPDGSGQARRLALDFLRLRTSVEVRRTRQLGGHLPSATRSNTTQVLFSNYLRGDPATLEWARDVMGEALADAEQAALRAHQAALQTSTGGRTSLTVLTTGDQAAPGAVEAACTSCVDPQQHPATGTACQATLLDCLHCGNCVVTPDHLPGLLALLDEVNQRRQQLPEPDWWRRYGHTWAAIRQDVLARFTPAEVEQAAARKPAGAVLDLIENPWEQP